MMGDLGFSFDCRMHGASTEVYVPYQSIIQMNCPDSSLIQEFAFELDFLKQIKLNRKTTQSSNEDKTEVNPPVKSKPTLRVVK
jgi:stringent starvation protein B